MSRGLLTMRSICFLLACCYSFLSASHLLAGDYLNSAHGSSSDGVFRPIIGNTPPTGFGYSQGNCAHCHEQHASIAGSEPPPSSGNPSKYELFAENFNIARRTAPYAESDNFCFYCHNNPTSAQSVFNNDYSQVFGCAPQGTTTIMSAMNQTSYHNLYDVWNYSNDQFTWFTSFSNPCDSCHNPHLARQNWANPQDPAYSAISKPTDHFSLSGTTETMGSSYNTKYEPPYCSNNLTDREPAASSDAISGRANTPDYVAFCITCHTTTSTIFSTSLNRNLTTIDWGNNGDKHGLRPMDGSVSTMAPYDTPSTGTDFVLSCLDCHEAHGSNNIMLLRRRVNGSDLSDSITTFDTTDWGLICMKCHTDDAASGIILGGVNQWAYVHHMVSDAPYTAVLCTNCHIAGSGAGGGGPPPIPCQDCHTHSGTVTKPDKNGIIRIGF
jgi:hypothetical protein